VHWSRPGDSSVGREMLNLLFIFLICSNAFCCWDLQGFLVKDGQTWKFHQKVQREKKHTIPLGAYLFSFELTEKKDKQIKLSYQIHKKQSLQLELISQGQDEHLFLKKEHHIFTKAENDQTHPIISMILREI
jgi:hypothetical protein